MEEDYFLIEGAQPGQDLSHPFTVKNEDLNSIQKGIKLENFRENMNSRDLNWEFKLLRRLTENQMYTNHFRDYHPEILKLDRYTQVLPFKHSIVKLPNYTMEGGESETYINANYISSSKVSEQKAFIATQGPLETTRGHFWRMIWHNDVKLIIMLCKFKEDGKPQSDQYWKPEKEELDMNPLSVSLTSTQKSENFTKRTFLLKGTDGDEKEIKEKIVTHYQWTAWPDHSTPVEEDINVISTLLDLMYKERTNNPESPVVVHCSAGIGRSGTLISLYNLEIVLRENLNNLENVKLSVFGVVRRLREQRWGMVNTTDQYAFIYKFIADRIDKYLKNAALEKVALATQE